MKFLQNRNLLLNKNGFKKTWYNLMKNSSPNEALLIIIDNK